ncbi:secretory phospholipase A2 receptor-like [Garra rufa]|uniref:secretory phospholipase A2 receptor-like n=1 Tax=Garra rufa TaxID=137080 RepID=UPI003CCECB61
MDRITFISLLLTAVVSSSAGALHQYHFVNQKMNWTEAQRYCRENHTDLVTITDIQEENDIKQLVNGKSVWIGLSLTWIWSLSDPAFYTANESRYRNWSSKPQQQDCVYMDCKNGQTSGNEQNSGIGHEGKWRDANCNDTKHFICYNDKLVLVRENKTWPEALRHCRNIGRDLVSVDSEQMQQSVMYMTVNASSTHVWLGLRHSCTVGIWFWVNGQTVCYDQWAHDYDEGLNECETTVRSGVFRTSDKKWISRPQTDTYNFICSK